MMHGVSQGPLRLDIIEHIKGAAILLVVAAHLVKYQTLDAPSWYELFKFKVYLFHMPLFMFASGYVYFHMRAHEKALHDFRAYAVRRADRLLLPFLAVGLAAVLGKLAFARFAYVDEAPPTLAAGLLSLVLHTENSPALTIWYLFVLFVFSLVTPWLLHLLRQNRILLALLAAALYLVELPDILFANRVTQFYLFFVAGGVAQSWHLLERRPKWPFAAAAALLFAILVALPLERPLGLVLCGMAACAAVPALLHHAGVATRRVLQTLGRNAMTIYLFNVFAIGLAKVVFLKLVPYDRSTFPLLLLVTFASGVLVPILIRRSSALLPPGAPLRRYLS
jgi:fucose 4-O-acetylase-like acetyltransferase